jgi:hypothetical protein
MKIDTPDPNQPPIEVPDQDSWGRALWDGFQNAFGRDPLGNMLFGGMIRFVVWCVEWFVDTFEYITVKFVGILTALQGKAGSNYYPLVGSIIGDVLGSKISGSAIAGIAQNKGDVAANRAIGASLLNTLEKEFSETNTISEEQGAKALQSFLGFLMEYAIKEGNLEVMTDLKIVPFIGSLRSYSANLARNLGLGRQARSAMRPLIDILVTTPYRWNLNKVYRPTKPSESVLTKAFHGGEIGKEQFETEMARLGHSDQYIAILENESSFHLSDAEWARRIRRNIVSEQNAIIKLRKEGLTEEEAKQKLDAVDYARQDSRYTEHVNAIESLFVNGWIDLSTFNQYISTLPLSAGEKRLEEVIVQVKRNAAANRLSISQAFETWQRGIWTELDFNKWAIDSGYQKEDLDGLKASIRPILTLSDMETAYIQGLIDLDDWNNYLKDRGYTTADRLILTQQLFLKMDKAKQPKPKKGLSLAELRRAFKAGSVSSEQFIAGAAALGYSAESIQIFLEELAG